MYLTLEFHLITNASVITTHPLVLSGLSKRSRKWNCESFKKAERVVPQVLVIERSTTVSLETCPFICLLSKGSIRQFLSKTYFIFLPTKISTLSLSVICEIKWSVCEKRGTHYFKVYQRCFHVYRVYRGETRLSRLFRFQNLVQDHGY